MTVITLLDVMYVPVKSPYVWAYGLNVYEEKQSYSRSYNKIETSNRWQKLGYLQKAMDILKFYLTE